VAGQAEKVVELFSLFDTFNPNLRSSSQKCRPIDGGRFGLRPTDAGEA